MPIVVNLSQAEHASDQPGLCMFNRATEDVIVIKVEIYHLTVAVDSQAGNIVAQVLSAVVDTSR